MHPADSHAVLIFVWFVASQLGGATGCLSLGSLQSTYQGDEISSSEKRLSRQIRLGSSRAVSEADVVSSDLFPTSERQLKVTSVAYIVLGESLPTARRGVSYA